MSITERTLRQWRKQSLQRISNIHSFEAEASAAVTGEMLTNQLLIEKDINERVLRLTQELLDQYLLRKE